MPRLETPRLVLLPATIETLRAELEGRAALAAAVGATVSEEWPPELYDENATKWTLAALEREPAYADWGMHYVLLSAGATTPGTAALIGTSGIKGPPNPAGMVEIGYSILPAHQRRGYAREAVDGLLAFAFADPRVTMVIAHTLPELIPSIGVLQSAGFAFAGNGDDPDEPTAIRYELSRQRYQETVKDRAAVRIIRDARS